MVGNSLVSVYSKFGRIGEAVQVFDEMPVRDCVSYNSLIWGFGFNGFYKEALLVFDRMEELGFRADPVSTVSALKACGELGSVKKGAAIHELVSRNGFGSDIRVLNSLISMYSKFGRLDLACDLFDEMPERDLVSWGTMIAGCVQFGDSKKALELFTKMQALGIRVDEVTMASLLSACAQLGARDQGKWFHAYIFKCNIKLDVILSTSLIDMYSKCGGIEIAVRVFRLMPKKDRLAWNATIMGLAVNGYGEKSLGVFREMQREGEKPDDVTFIGVLCACSHAGLLDEGLRYFELMTRVHRIKPREEHYGCMVDLLGRAGLLEEAQEFIRKMPVEPNAAIWGALLGGCLIHGNVELGEYVGRLLINLEPHHSGRYVVLSNLYANANRWDDAKSIREMMKEKGIQKIPGRSTIEAKGVVHEFVMGDRSHPQTKAIYEMLDEMAKQLKLAGYTPDTSKVLFNLDEEEKESALCYHSEKLAIAFGLINLGSDMPIRIVKNLRVCVDCHSATKLISKIYKRKIVVRDRSRFHHFEDGYCSCKDYW